jgi:hypothetical protein
VYRIFGRLRELWAIVASALTLIVGGYLAWTHAPVWLNRAGALIIIFGVLLAASRFNEWLHAKVTAFIESNYQETFDTAVATLEKDRGEPLPKENRDELHVKLKPAIHREVGALIDERKRVFKLYEIGLVVLGTFLNGFGDYIVCQLKNCSP